MVSMVSSKDRLVAAKYFVAVRVMTRTAREKEMARVEANWLAGLDARHHRNVPETERLRSAARSARCAENNYGGICGTYMKGPFGERRVWRWAVA